MPLSIMSGWDAGIQVRIFNFTLLSLHGENLTSSQLPAQLASECWEMSGSKICGGNEGDINCGGLSSFGWHCRFFLSFIHRLMAEKNDTVELGNSMQEWKGSDPNHTHGTSESGLLCCCCKLSCYFQR